MKHAKLDLVKDIALHIIGVVAKALMVIVVRLIAQAVEVTFYISLIQKA